MRRSALLLAVLAACAHPTHGAGAQAAYVAAMSREHAGHTPVAGAPAVVRPRQEVVGEEVVYGTVGGEELRGYLARPAGARADLPGVVVVHEWWGLNDNVRAMARRLAGEGYA
ncbi:MAG TPA: dienelactone hydrolase family protein, partial [Longimicrobiaceae bacterium]|nr:dienelactone hydrolase family protein [Longimicrobiaceae bacterium]